MLKGKFSSRRRVTEEVDAMSGLANLSDVMLVFACGLMAAVILNWNVDLSKTRVEILQREQMQELDNAEELEQDIRPTGFYHNKAKNIIACCQRLMALHGGEVPSGLEELTALPGVGRKTANVIRGNIFHEPSVVVDTHVKRISKKLGLTKEDDPEKVEYELMKVLPKNHWILYNIQIITLGRTICKAPTPKCGECFLTEWCKDYQNRQKKESRKKK